MTRALKKIINLDYFLISSVAVLSFLGLLSIYSSKGVKFLERQAIFFALGILVFFFFAFFDWRAIKENSFLILGLYFIGIALLLGLLFFASPVRNVRRWYNLGPFLFAPAEFIKLALIIFLAKYFSVRHVEMYQIRHILVSGITVALPSFLIFRQPDLGSSLILIFLWIGILLISGIKLKHFLILCLVGILLSFLAWGFIMQDYQKERIISFMDPQFDPQGIGWGGTHARIAIGNGGFLGQGIGEGSQTKYGFLPEPHTDFIFAAIAEEMGFLTVSVLILAIGVFIGRISLFISKTKTNFPRLFAAGFLVIFISQAFINIGMNLGLLPIMGTPLPLVSYGGSNLIFTFAGLGIIENMRRSL